MYFAIAALTVALACSTITIRTLIGYSDFRPWAKIAIAMLVLLGWFAPVIINSARDVVWLGGENFTIITRVGYFMFGFVFLLFCMLILRDLLWYLFYGVAKLFGHASWSVNPKNITVLDRFNFFTLIFTLAVALYALWNGIKSPAVDELTIVSPKIQEEMRIVQVSDVHIDRTTSLRRLRNFVDQVNVLHPDVIVLTGDIIDDKVEKIFTQLEILRDLRARYGVYASIGNHELYSGINSSLYKYRDLGFKVLFNRGVFIGDTNVYVAGIPDMHTAMAKPNLNADFEKATKGSSSKNYKILLSHNPDFVDYITSVAFDLQLSGHTHGGQIFPFHLLVLNSNGYLSGSYTVNGVKLYVSNGVGTWGPMMRLFAPANMALIKLQPSSKIKSQ